MGSPPTWWASMSTGWEYGRLAGPIRRRSTSWARLLLTCAGSATCSPSLDRWGERTDPPATPPTGAAAATPPDPLGLHRAMMRSRGGRLAGGHVGGRRQRQPRPGTGRTPAGPGAPAGGGGSVEPGTPAGRGRGRADGGLVGVAADGRRRGLGRGAAEPERPRDGLHAHWCAVCRRAGGAANGGPGPHPVPGPADRRWALSDGNGRAG